jgi:hypothetical protein
LAAQAGLAAAGAEIAAVGTRSRHRRAGIRRSVAVASGALQESRRDEAKGQTAGEEKLRLPSSKILSLIDQIADIMLPEVARQTFGLLGSLVGVMRDRILSLFAKLVAGLVGCVNNRVQAVDRPFFLHFK